MTSDDLEMSIVIMPQPSRARLAEVASCLAQVSLIECTIEQSSLPAAELGQAKAGEAPGPRRRSRARPPASLAEARQPPLLRLFCVIASKPA